MTEKQYLKLKKQVVPIVAYSLVVLGILFLVFSVLNMMTNFHNVDMCVNMERINLVNNMTLSETFQDGSLRGFSACYIPSMEQVRLSPLYITGATSVIWLGVLIVRGRQNEKK
jgi:uncharacterized membrane protein